MPDVGAILEKIFIVAQIIVGLGLLIFIHEAGHFLVAKWKGVRVDAFSLGMGPILWKRLWKGTEYRISAIPLGGYVKMAGENIGDPKTGAPDELTSKPAFARLQIFAAGAIMNLLIAFPLAILACLAGRTENSPVIGGPSYADTAAGIQPGDKVIEAGGQKIASLDDYRKHMVRLPHGTVVPVTVEREGRPVTVEVKAMASPKHGSVPPPTTIVRIKSGSPADKAGIRSFAEIHSINGEPARFSVLEFREQMAAATLPVTLVVKNPEEAPRTVVLEGPSAPPEEWISRDWSLIEPVISQPESGSPAAEAGLKADDVITRIGDKEIASFQDIANAVKDRGGQRVAIEYLRGGAAGKGETLIRYLYQDRGGLGVGPGRSSKFVSVSPDSPFYKAGLRSGDELISVDDYPNVAVNDIAFKGRPGPVKLKVKRGEQTLEFKVEGAKRERFNLEAAGFSMNPPGVLEIRYNHIERRWGFKEAIVAGLYEPIDVIDITFRILGKLFVREEDPAGLAGPVGIFRASLVHAEAGLGNFLWLLVLITVNLGIFNLLPVPVLDGGHILLLAIEKVRGAPPSPRFVERFQLVGLVLLLSLLVFVTVNDLR